MGKRSNASLLGACALLGALLGLLALALRGTPGSGRESGAPSTEVARGEERNELAPAAALAPIATRVALEHAALQAGDGGSASPTPPAVSAVISGRLRLDGAPAQGGRVVLRSADGAWERAAVIDPEGRFRIGAVPSAAIELAFELPPGEGRLLLLPRVEVFPAAGASEELELAWAPHDVNLRVLGDGPGGNRARVEVEGPRTVASFDTDEDGKARLSVVGQGLFTFRAVQLCGREGAASLELEEGSGLDSLVITARLPDAR